MIDYAYILKESTSHIEEGDIVYICKAGNILKDKPLKVLQIYWGKNQEMMMAKTQLPSGAIRHYPVCSLWKTSETIKESKGPNTPKITFKAIKDALYQWYEYQLDFNSNFSKERTEEAYNDICNIIKESESLTFSLINKIIHKIEWYGYDSWQFQRNIYERLN